tara:strand:+ start:187 stop:576 length:390 start_codon:yes stop_codon:yes gene_type:complete
MEFLSTIKKATLVAFIYLMGIISAQATSENCECGEPENVWFKLSTENGIQRVVQLDMTKGKSFTDEMHIYLVVQDIETKELIYIVFPNGGEWVAEEKDPMLEALEKEFKDLEEYLKATQSKRREIKKKQ